MSEYNETLLVSLINAPILGTPIHFFDTVESTNETAKELAEKGATHGTLVLCDRQTKGKGSNGRLWLSLDGNDIMMSVILRPDTGDMLAHHLAMAAALSVFRAISDVVDTETIVIKPPNDILISKKKVSGILSQSVSSGDVIEYVILGIGINVNSISFGELREKATSIKAVTGRDMPREPIVAGVLNHFDRCFDSFRGRLRCDSSITDYEQRLKI